MDSHDLESLNDTMKGIAGASFLAQSIAAYDGYAQAAMTNLMSRAQLLNYEQISDSAWKMADAMMTERKNRGLGGGG